MSPCVTPGIIKSGSIQPTGWVTFHPLTIHSASNSAISSLKLFFKIMIYNIISKWFCGYISNETLIREYCPYKVEQRKGVYCQITNMDICE